MTYSDAIQTECVIIGAGVVGLAVARELSKTKEVVLLERNVNFGEETSSRNSEVIHSGIYYPIGSKKTEWCIRGRHLLYHFCEEAHVPYKKTGKFLVATTASELEYLEIKAEHCNRIGVVHERITREHAKRILPYLCVEEAIFFPETGIIDSHLFMQALEAKAVTQGSALVYQHEITSIERQEDRWKISGVAAHKERFEILATTVVNAGGLIAAKLSDQALKMDRYEHRFCRGRYFNVTGQHPFSHLIYPVPPKDGLGVHVTIDLAGSLRLGPDIDWSDSLSYDCDWASIRGSFAKAARAYWPGLNEERLNPGLVGIRPKLYIDGVASPDFLVENHGGFIHCLGIESPGLTSALAIAENVGALIKGNLL